MENEPAQSYDEVCYCSLYPPGKFEKHMKRKIGSKLFKCHCCTLSCMENQGLNNHIVNHAPKFQSYQVHRKVFQRTI